MNHYVYFMEWDHPHSMLATQRSQRSQDHTHREAGRHDFQHHWNLMPLSCTEINRKTTDFGDIGIHRVLDA